MTKWTTRDLHNLTSNSIESPLPLDLAGYLHRCHELPLSFTISEDVERDRISIADEVKRKMKAKKQHEVSRMGGTVNRQCYQFGCNCILDIGSGLGYLGHCLSTQCGLDVIEIEREGERVESANVRVGSHIKQSFSLSVDSTDQCRTKLQSLIDTLNGTSCITGLHCCGDLSIHLMTLFPSLSSPLLILVPCCYHKVSSSSPLSDTMKRALGDCGLSQYLSIYGLRLAAQDSPIRYKMISIKILNGC
jgi:hypothetical protein